MSDNSDPAVVGLRRGETHPLDSSSDSFDLENAAHQLAGIPRWNAGTDPYISLATHLVGTSIILEENGEGPEMQLYGQTHDNPERVTGDMPHPLKYMSKDREIALDLDHSRLDEEILEENTDDMPIELEDMEAEELLDLYQTLGEAFGIRFKDYLDPIDDNILSGVYDEMGLEGPDEEQEKRIKGADLEATAYEILDAEPKYRENALENWEDDYEERVREKMAQVEEIPDWLYQSREEAKENYITRFENLVERI